MKALAWMRDQLRRSTPNKAALEIADEPIELPPPAPFTSSLPPDVLGEPTQFRGKTVDELVVELHRLAGISHALGDRLFVAHLLRMITNDGVKPPAMPEVVVRIQRLIASPSAELDDLAKVIAQEPMLTARLMRVASSPVFGASSAARNLTESLVRLGLRETRNIVFAILCRAKLFRVPGEQEEAQRMYRLALASSVAAQILAGPLGVDKDDAFIAGMIHDVGEVVLLATAADVHRASRKESRVRPIMFEEAERVLHARIGALVAEAWGFSPRIVHAIAGHHAPDDALPGARALADTLFLADEIAERVIESDQSETMFAPHPAFTLLGIDEPGALAGEAKLAFQALEDALVGDDD